MEESSRTIERPAVPVWRLGMAPRTILIVVAIGSGLLLAISVPPLVSGSERTLTFASQDFPFDNTMVGAGLSKSFWLSAGEWIRPELVERVSNRSSGAFVWQGPVDILFLHDPPGESGRVFWPPMTAPRHGYYALEVHHHDCQDEVALCPIATANLSYATSGLARVVSSRPYPYLAPSVSVFAATGSAASLGLTYWRLVRLRSRPPAASRQPTGANWRPLISAVLLVVALVLVGSVGLDAIYRPQVSAQASSFGSWGFVSDNPCVLGQTNVMVLYVSVYNGADEPLTIWVEGRVAGAPDQVSRIGINMAAHSITRAGVGLYTTTDCKDPAAEIRITGIWPSWR